MSFGFVRIPLACVLLLSVLMLPHINVNAAPDATTYYVSPSGNDANPGSQTQPLRSIQKAIDRARAGDTVYVRGGTYREIVRITTPGAPGQPIRIMAFPNEKPVIDGAYNLPGGTPAQCDNGTGEQLCFVYAPLVSIEASHIIFSGFEVTRSRGRGILVSQIKGPRPEYVTIQNCHIHHTRFQPLKVMFADRLLIEGCEIDHGINFAPYSRSGENDLGWGAGLAMQDSEDSIIRYNVVHENYGEGINTGRNTINAVVEDNISYNNLALQFYMHRTQGTLLQRNLAYHTNDPEFWRSRQGPGDCYVINNERHFQGSATVDSIIIRNNVAVGCGANIIIWSSQKTGAPVENVLIEHNLLVNAKGGKKAEGRGFAVSAVANIDSIRFQNNIILQNEGTLAAIQANSGIRFANNLWSRTPSGNASGLGDIIADPQLTDPAAPLIPGRVRVDSYKPRAGSPASANNIGPREYLGQGPSDGIKLPTPAPTSTPGGPPETIPPTPTPQATPVNPAPTPVRPTPVPGQGRVTDGLQVLYAFDGSDGNIVHDVSGVGPPLDLKISSPSAVAWQEGRLQIQSPVVISSDRPATKINKACRDSGEVTAEAWIMPAIAEQGGPARILTISPDSASRNLMLGQGLGRGQAASVFNFRLRTTNQNSNGLPAISSVSGASANNLHHLVYTRDRTGMTKIFIDGKLDYQGRIRGAFSNWNLNYPLTLANETDGQRPWLGGYDLVAVYCRTLSAQEIEQNYRSGPQAAAPAAALGRLHLTPNNVNAVLNDQFEVAVVVNMGAEEIDSVAAYLNFDPNILEAISIEPGNQLPDIVTDEIDNENGHVNFVASTTGASVDGLITVATMTFEAKTGVSATEISLSSQGARTSDIALSGQSSLGGVEGAHIRVNDMILRGKIGLEGRPNSPHATWVKPLQIRLLKEGEEQPSYSFAVESTEDGFFTLPPVAIGNYRMAVKASNTLQRVANVNPAQSVTPFEVGILLEGDAVPNDVVDLLDLSSLAGSFNLCSDRTGYLVATDFNADGCIEAADFTMLVKNFGQVGEPLGKADFRTEQPPRSLGHILAKQQGERFTITVAATHGTESAFDTAAFYLNFDPTQVRIVSVTPGSAFDTVLQNQVDHEAGILNLVATILQGEVKVPIDIARIEFEVLQSFDQSALSLAQSGPRTSGLAHDGDIVFFDVQFNGGDTIDIETIAAQKVYLPSIER